MASVPQPSIAGARQDLYRRMDRNNLAPLWEVLHNLIPSEPSTPCKPALWKYREARPYLMEAGKLISAREAIRRVLTIAGESFAFEPRDTFVVPSWMPVELETKDDAVLFSFSDRPGQEAMGLWRAKRG